MLRDSSCPSHVLSNPASFSWLNSSPRCPSRWLIQWWEGSTHRPRSCLQPSTVLSIASFHGQTLPCGQSPANVLAGHKGQGELVNGLVELDSMLAPPVCWSWGLTWSNFTQVITRAFKCGCFSLGCFGLMHLWKIPGALEPQKSPPGSRMYTSEAQKESLASRYRHRDHLSYL